MSSAPHAAAAPANEPAPLGAAPQQPRHLALGLALLFGGGAAAFFMMSRDRHLPRGALWGMLATALAACGVLEILGLLRSNASAPSPRYWRALPGEPRLFAPGYGLMVGLALLFCGYAAGGVTALPWPLTGALLLLLPASLRRPSLLVFTISSLLFLPLLGAYGLWDPWETHYGEVAREILARDDWITLWWAQDEWFRSKPVLIFWIEALTWSGLGIPFTSDGNPSHPEWALRLPIYVLSEIALLACYAVMARLVNRRAGVLGALVLATTPYFFFLSHQAITDMPFVATMTAALAFLVFALEADPEREVRTLRLGPFSVSAQSLAIFAVVMVALPQALYLLTRNLSFLTTDLGFWPHRDEFVFGSAGNGNVPGNPALRTRQPYLSALYYQPFAQGLWWLSGLFALVYVLRRERKEQGLAMVGFYFFASLSWLAKGIPGIALPGLIAALYLVATGRWSLLFSGRLRVTMGLVTIAVTGLPWYVAMYGRLGPFFTDRLLIHDHLNRLAQGVHGDTGSIQYFLQQLGYGAFPWLGLFPVGLCLFRFMPISDDPRGVKLRRALILLSLWAAAAFTLFSAMVTKFHHYVFPAVPPLALLTGIVLDRSLGKDSQEELSFAALLLAAVSSLCLAVGAAGFYGNLRGIVPELADDTLETNWIAQHGLPSLWCWLLLGAGALALLSAALLDARHNRPRARSALDAALAIAFLASALIVAFAGRDLSWATTERPLGHERLIDLFVYNYQRPFPAHLDYRPMLSGFAVLFTVLLLCAALSALRRAAIFALLAGALLFSVWSLDVYMIDLSPHWSQRTLIKRYYAQRKSAKEPLIAWQMNWKGENLYTANRVHVFVQLDNKAINKWLGEHAGQRAYFVLEHSRLNNFKRMMGKRHVVELSTARENNKFILVRANI